jgi:hypothetical protein
MIAVLLSIAVCEDTIFHITFASPPRLAIHVGFLGARRSIETGVFVFPTNLHGNLTLQTGISRRTGTVHACCSMGVRVLPREPRGIFFDIGV